MVLVQGPYIDTGFSAAALLQPGAPHRRISSPTYNLTQSAERRNPSLTLRNSRAKGTVIMATGHLDGKVVRVVCLDDYPPCCPAPTGTPGNLRGAWNVRSAARKSGRCKRYRPPLRPPVSSGHVNPSPPFACPPAHRPRQTGTGARSPRGLLCGQ